MTNTKNQQRVIDKFEYQSNNDSIIIYNFYEEQNLVLKKFEFKDFNIELV